MSTHSQSIAPQISRTKPLATRPASETIPLRAARRLDSDLPLIPRPHWLPESVWPFNTRALEVDGATIAVTDVGQGPTLLFVHTGTWSFMWRDVMLRLSSDFRCVCLDAPGTGLSDLVPRWGVTLDAASRAVTAVIERLDLTDVTLAFHDLGGAAGLAGAARVADRIRGLAAVNTFGWKPEGRAFRGMLALMGSAFMREFDVAVGLIPFVGSSSFGAGRHLDAAGRRAYAAPLYGDRLRSFHYYLREARTNDAIFNQISAALAGPFRNLPLVTIFGEKNDPLGFQPRWKTMYADALQVVVKGGNHYPMCDDPDLVANTIRTWHHDRVAPGIK